MKKYYPIIKNYNKRRRLEAENQAGPSRAPIEERAQEALEQDYEMADDPNGNVGVTDGTQPNTLTGSNTTGGVGNSSMGGMRGHAELPTGTMPQYGSYTRTISKQYELRIFNKLSEHKVSNINGINSLQIRTNHNSIPVQYLGFYLNELEFQRLKKHTRVTVVDCSVDVYTRTLDVVFNTNSGNTTVGNNNVGGLFQFLDPMLHKKVNFVPETGGEALIREKFLGTPTMLLNSNTNWSTNMQGLGAQYIRRNYSNRVAIRSIQTSQPFKFGNADITSTRQNSVPIHQFVRKSYNCSMEEGKMWTWQYKPKNGIIIENSNYAGNDFPTQNGTIHGKTTKVPTFRNKAQGWNAESSLDHPEGNNVFAERGSANNVQTDVFMNSRKDEYLHLLIDNEFAGSQNFGSIPGLYMGLDPLVGIENEDGNAELVPAHIDVTLKVNITLAIQDGTDYDPGYYELFAEHDHKNPTYQRYFINTGGQLRAYHEDYFYTSNRNGFTLPELTTVDTTLSPDMGYIAPLSTQQRHESGYTHEQIADLKAAWYPVTGMALSARIAHPNYKEYKLFEAFKAKYPGYVKPARAKRQVEELSDDEEEIEEVPTKKPSTLLPFLSNTNL